MLAAAGTRLGFVTWDRGDPTGGNVYNRALVVELRALGINVRLHVLAGPWPEGDASSHLKLARALRAEPACIVDGIVGSGSPAVVAAAVDSGHVVTILIHLPISDEVDLEPMQRQRYTALEAKTVQAASGVLCSSRWSAAELRRRYGRSDVGVAIPGVTPAPVARGSQDSGPPRILSVASLTPTKDQLTLVHALAQLADLQWTADLIGSDQADPDYADRLRAEIVAAGLHDRILVPGALAGSVLDQNWDTADLLVLPSRIETFGLVVVEALARGIPAVVTAGTGAIEALQEGATKHSAATPGTSVPAADSAGLAAVLRRWLTEPTLRHAWRQAALARRDTLPGWQQTAQAALAYLYRLHSPLSTQPGSPPAPPPTPPPGPPPSAASSPS
ncbi:MAG TPA: glycosyltransferase family 4 protein [Propionibacteriaceae bacterium]|nr:glycosyltransferase family 4 protein [Propionibacteriaceae bacterium]